MNRASRKTAPFLYPKRRGTRHRVPPCTSMCTIVYYAAYYVVYRDPLRSSSRPVNRPTLITHPAEKVAP
jgi:hypothetical protein